ncbi:hypothetical protein B0T24DRAFT_705615, partial [Lasiosphaeria ovina]
IWSRDKDIRIHISYLSYHHLIRSINHHHHHHHRHHHHHHHTTTTLRPPKIPAMSSSKKGSNSSKSSSSDKKEDGKTKKLQELYAHLTEAKTKWEAEEQNVQGLRAEHYRLLCHPTQSIYAPAKAKEIEEAEVPLGKRRRDYYKLESKYNKLFGLTSTSSASESDGAGSNSSQGAPSSQNSSNGPVQHWACCSCTSRRSGATRPTLNDITWVDDEPTSTPCRKCGHHYCGGTDFPEPDRRQCEIMWSD